MTPASTGCLTDRMETFAELMAVCKVNFAVIAV
jgi:hypothetical protein